MNKEYIKITPDILATKGQRFTNNVIDVILLQAFSYGLAYLFFYIGEYTGYYGMHDYWNAMSTFEDYLIGYIIHTAYFFIMESLTNKTVGKYITKTKVISQEGNRLTEWKIFIRSLCRLIPFDTFSFLGENGRGWHDSISKTYVVDIAKYEAKKKSNDSIDQIGQAI